MDRRWILVFFLPALAAFGGGSEKGRDPGECDTMCNEMGSGQNLEHYSFWSGGVEARGNPPDEDHDKWHWGGEPGECDTWHPDCSVSEEIPEERLDGLHVALQVDDLNAARAMVEELGHRVVVNPQRGMVHALGCGGVVVANLPLTAEQMAALKDWE